MSLRRSGLPMLALAALMTWAGCKDVNQRPIVTTIVVATFASPTIPTPNDLALQATPTLPASAQKNLLQSFVNQGGFPADQAPTLSVPIRAFTWDEATHSYVAAETLPELDPTSVTSSTAALFRIDGAAVTRVDVEAAAPALPGQVNVVPVADAAGSRRLPAGRYVFAIRGGAEGVKTTDGVPIAADVPIAVTIPNKDLANPENQPTGGLTPAQVTQLSTIQALLWNPVAWLPVNLGAGNQWIPCLPAALTAAPQALKDACTAANTNVASSAYGAIDAAFPHAQVASIAAFQIAPPSGATIPVVDSASGQAPLPIDLLRTGPGGTIALNPAFGPAAAGLTTLDGFSTTAMLLAPVARPGSATAFVRANTVTGANVFLYKLGGATPELLPELKTSGPGSSYVAEPDPIVSSGVSPVIGLQPAANPGIPGVYLPPLEESTSYAVVITNRVLDEASHPLGRPTVMTLLLDPNPLVHPQTGASLVGGVSDATAAALQQMRAQLAPVLANLPAGTTTADVALAYTFKTQSITPRALQLAAAPYAQAGVGSVLSADFLTPAQVAAQYGIAEAFLPATPAEFAEVKLATVSLLLDSQNSGAFDPDHPAAEVVTALVAIPNAATVTAVCAADPSKKCAPLVVFRHGITRSKADLLPVATTLTAAGFVVAAIDGEKHGDRSYCTSDAQCCPAALCGAASTCAIKANLTTPVDGGMPIGVCESSAGVRGSYLNYRVDCAEPTLADGTPNPACLSPKGVPFVSGNYLVSTNFFRTRDSLRQDIIDQSALVKALAPTAASSDAFAARLASRGMAVNPLEVYLVGHSLGAIQGAVDIAVNPRISRAVFAAPGATVVDIFADPQSRFHEKLLALLAPVQEGSSDYLKLLQVAKWILDPADPANFGRHLFQEPLTSPLNAAGFPNPDRSGTLLVQNALCDGTIPNRENAFFASQLGLAVPTPGDSTTGLVQWYAGGSSGVDCTTNAVSHGFLLLDPAHPTLTLTAQATAAGFLSIPAAQPATIRP